MNIGLSKIIPEILLTAWGILTTVFFFTAKGKKGVSIKVFILSSLVTIILAAIAGLEVLIPSFFENPVSAYLCSCLLFLVYGVLNTYFIRLRIGIEEGKSFFPELAFTFITGFLLAGVYGLLFFYLKPGELPYLLIFTSATLSFLIPFLFYQSFIFFLKIPSPSYKKWYYNHGKDYLVDDTLYEDTNIILLTFGFSRTHDEKDWIELRAKVPLRLEFKKAFANVIADNNRKNPGLPIQLIDEYDIPDGWEFFIEEKGNFWSDWYIDPDLTVAENKLKNNEVVICNRG